MSSPTHVTFALFMYLLLLTTAGVALNPVNAAVVALSSLLPDIDTGASSVGMLLPFISLRIERRFGHRTVTHSALFIAALGLAALPLMALDRDLYLCTLAGYASHPFLDTMTVNGVKLFHPFSPAKCVFPLEVNNPHRYRIRTGGRLDGALGFIFLIACGPMFYVAYQGYERFIRATQQNIEAGVRDYEELSRDYLVLASVNAVNMLTKQPVTATVEIVGALNPHTLVFKGPDRQLHTMGRDFEADFTVRSILCEKGAPANSSLRKIEAGHRFLSEVVSSLDTASENYLFGDLTTSDRISLPENIRMFTPVSGGGSLIRLNYATSEDIRACNLEHVFLTKGIVTVKTIHTGPGDSSGISPANASGAGDIIPIRILLDPKDSVVVLRAPGDSVTDGDIIARKVMPRLYADQKALLEEKFRAVRARAAADGPEADARIAEAGQLSKIDSAEASRAGELLRNGFIPDAVFRIAQLKWQKSGRVVSDLFASKAASEQKKELEIRSLNLAIREIDAKSASLRRESEIRSPRTGILLEIRRIPCEGKAELYIFIKPVR